MSSAANSKQWVGCAVVMMTLVLMKSAGAMPHPEKAAERLVPLHLDANSLLPFHSVRPLYNHSISPWTYNTSYDVNRYPPFVSEAHCTLQGCRDANGAEDHSLESKPIWYQMLFLRRVKPTGAKSYHYRLETKVVSVGCTCVRPSIQHQH